jgi:hypothetical protein
MIHVTQGTELMNVVLLHHNSVARRSIAVDVGTIRHQLGEWHKLGREIVRSVPVAVVRSVISLPVEKMRQ